MSDNAAPSSPRFAQRVVDGVKGLWTKKTDDDTSKKKEKKKVQLGESPLSPSSSSHQSPANKNLSGDLRPTSDSFEALVEGSPTSSNFEDSSGPKRQAEESLGSTEGTEASMNGEAYAIRNRTESRANLLRAKNHNAYRIVLTGGPCAGKSSAAAELQEQLTSHGFLVFTLPEIATVMFNAGANWTQFAETEEGLAAFQSELTKLQIAQEDSFLRLCGVTEKPCVVICDRGLMDGKAYCTPKVWDIVQKKLWMNESRMLARYDAVAFMVTAADGAEEFYTKDNNAARRENPEEAVKVDRKLKDCWQQHRNLAVFDNTCTTFQSKVQSVVQFVLNQVAAANQPRKFYIQGDIEQCKRSFPKDVEFTEEIIEEIESSVGLLRAVSSLEQTRYYVREQKLVGDVVIEKTSKVGAKEFDGYRSIAADDGNEPTIKSSLHFTIDGIVWEIYYSDSAKAHVLLTYADANRDLARAMPTFLDYSEEIGPQDSDYPIGN